MNTSSQPSAEYLAALAKANAAASLFRAAEAAAADFQSNAESDDGLTLAQIKAELVNSGYDPAALVSRLEAQARELSAKTRGPNAS